MAKMELLTGPWGPPGVAAAGPDWTLGAAASVTAAFSDDGTTTELVGQVNDAYTGSAWSAATWDLTSSRVAVHITPPNPGEGSIEAQLLLSAAAADPAVGDGLLWAWDRGGLRAGYRTAGVTSWAVQLTYDPLRHAWWRIRETNGLVLWDLSPDGITWTGVGFAARPAGLNLTTLRVTLRTGHWLTPSIEDPDPAMPTRWHAVNVTPDPPLDPATLPGEGLPYLAVDVIPDVLLGSFVVGESEVDGADLLAWTDIAEGSWLNVVCDVTGISLVRGAQRADGALQQPEAGTCTVGLQDTSRRFDPLANNDAVHPGTPLRVRAWGYDALGVYWSAVLFTGAIDPDGLVVRYVPEGPPLVQVTASDLIADMARWSSEGRIPPGTGAGNNLLERAQLVLAEMGLQPSTMALDVDSRGYAVTHPDTVLADPWGELLAARDAELGRLWIDRDNRLVVRTRGSALSGPVRGTMSDVHGDADEGTVHCCYIDPDARLDTQQSTNRAVAARRLPEGDAGPATVFRVEDNLAAARWGWSVTERMDLEVQTDAQAAEWAEQLVAGTSQPQVRVDAVTPAPDPVDLEAALGAWPAVCWTDLGDRWVFRYSPEQGPAVDRTLGVLGISVQATPDAWTVRLTTADAPTVTPGNPSGWFVLDVSELDSGDVLAPDAAVAGALAPGMPGWDGGPVY